jgi:aerobic-type carbon monoxide dehydrogenase small subunit (CoxS/CutS family)
MAAYTLRVNGRNRQVEADSGDSLLFVLRDEFDLSGSKFGCGEGQCGACTVLVGNGAVRACVTRIGAVGDAPITTIEGLASGDRLHPVQQAFLEAEAFQCGYCTPGMIVATVAMLRVNPAPTQDDIARLMDRNVCRCGAYPRIVRAVQLAARRMKGAGSTAARVVQR